MAKTWAEALQDAKGYALHPECDERLLMRLCWLGAICVAQGSDPEELDEREEARDTLLITAAFFI